MKLILKMPLHFTVIFQSLCITLYYLAFPSNFDRSVTFNLFHDSLEDRLVLVLLLLSILLMVVSLYKRSPKLIKLSEDLAGTSYGIILMLCIRHIVFYAEPSVSILFAIPGLVNVILASALEKGGV